MKSLAARGKFRQGLISKRRFFDVNMSGLREITQMTQNFFFSYIRDSIYDRWASECDQHTTA